MLYVRAMIGNGLYRSWGFFTNLRYLLIVAMLIIVVNAKAQVIDTTGCYLRDPLPTTACQPIVATVDSTLQLVQLSWHPSPDTDIMGYRICIERNQLWFDYDTVWGAMDTTYICTDISNLVTNRFRIMAFDSCLKGSTLSDPIGNLVLGSGWDSCNRVLTFSWDGDVADAWVDHYDCSHTLVYADGTEVYRVATLASSSNSTNLYADSGVVVVRSSVVAVDASGSLRSRSNNVQRHMQAWYPCNSHTPTPPDTIPEGPKVEVFCPNVFTPLLATNNLFYPVIDHPEYLTDYSLTLFNRQGICVFATKNPHEAWDGKSHGTMLPQGVYVYRIRYLQPGFGAKTLVGSILLLH